MSSFDKFIQLELPKRPFIQADPAQETVIVRRGAGPRQLAGIALNEGEVLAKVGGVVTGVPLAGSSFRKSITTVTTPTQVWTITHNLGSINIIIQVVDSLGYVIIPDEMHIQDEDTVVITFSTPQTGIARIIFLD